MARLPALRTSVRVNVTLSVGEHLLDLSEVRHLLRALADTHAILATAEALGMTYRTVWGRLALYEKLFGKSLVDKTPGQGTQLTPTGRAVLAALDREFAQLVPPEATRADAMTSALLAALGGEFSSVRVVASHDFAIANFFQHNKTRTPLEIRFMGGAKAARALLAGEAELAGFHTPIGSLSRADPIFQSVNQAKDFDCVPVMSREQGILIARGNPRGIAGLIDLAKPGVRFVNRQRGSGTRILLDHLLASCGLSADAIDGYEQEEFTHQAVAAMIGAGAADAGLGLRAAAEIFKLDFISIGWENYYLAGKSETLAQPNVKAFCDALIAQSAQMAGYRAVQPETEPLNGQR